MLRNQKSKFQFWVESTTCHGVQDLFGSKSIISKLFWTWLLFSCLGLALWQISELLTNFGSSPHYITHTHHEEAEFVQFPNVTICNFNRAHRQRVIEAEMVNESGALDPDLLNYLYLSFPGKYDAALFGFEFFRNITKGFEMLSLMREKYRRWQASINQTLADPVTIVKHLGYQCRELFFSCEWKGIVFDCCKYVKPVINAYGLCHSITPPLDDGGTIAKQTIPGHSQSLFINANVMLETYTMEVVQYNFLESGVLVNINYNPYEMDATNPIGIRPNTKAWIALKGRKRYTKPPKLKIFKSECHEDLKLDILKEYTRSACISDCFQKLNLQLCGCVLVSEVKVPGLRFCDGYEVVACILSQVLGNFSTESGNDLPGCIKLCERLPCKEALEIDASVSTATRIAEGREQYLVERFQQVFSFIPDSITSQITVARMKSSVSMNIFFSEISWLVMERNEKIPIFQLIGNIGGHLGIWLGVSILTIIQAIYHLAAALFKQDIGNEDQNGRERLEKRAQNLVKGHIRIVPLRPQNMQILGDSSGFIGY